MKPSPGTTGLIFNEPLLWEKHHPGRCGISLPALDVPAAAPDATLTGPGPDFPDLSEPDVVRHFTRLSQWNFGIDSGMYPLGSCTMKYNPKINEKLAGLPGWAQAHPLLPPELSQGALRLMFELEQHLAEITGMDATTLQPAAGAHGEFTAMLMFYAYHQQKGEKRHKILVPDTAHGTNPASATLCGYTPVAIASGPDGILLPQAVEALMDTDTAGIMVTNPNTLGFFENHIRDIADRVHAKGGLVYCDGANLNAVMGMVKMGHIGIDALHLNLHKTFATPHGGGGPGAGPVCVLRHLEPFLPVPRIVKDAQGYHLQHANATSIGKVHTFYGNFGVLVRAFCYILSMGQELKDVSRHAVLSANYIKEQLKDVLHLPYDQPCMHECVFSDKHQLPHKISTLDIAKRLMDYGFHPPTIYFPLVVPGALMVEPTETESKETLDQFIAAVRQIAREAAANPAALQEAPSRTKVRRLDEVGAARRPYLCGQA